MFRAADGNYGPSLLGLRLTDAKRKHIEVQVWTGLGVGSRENRTINQSIKEGATSQLALGFSATGKAFSELDGGYTDNHS